VIDGYSRARSRGGSRRHGPRTRIRPIPLVFALLFAVPAHVRSQDALPEPLSRADLIELNEALDDAFNDDLEDICRCRDVDGATRFETLLEELEAIERSIRPDALSEALLDEGLDVPVEAGDTPRSYLDRAGRRADATLVGRYEPLRDRLRDLGRMAENVEIVRRNRMNRFESYPPRPPPDVDREREILRTLRRLFGKCRGDEAIPPPPDDPGMDPTLGLAIDVPDRQPEGPPPTAATLRQALWHELKNLCCRVHEIPGGFGAWIEPASVGIGRSDPEVQEDEEEYRRLLGELERTMETRGFHDWVQDSEELSRNGLVRRRCTDETMKASDEGLLIRDDEPRRVSSVVDPPEGPPVPSIADRREDEPPRDDEPGPRGPPPGFRHVTAGADPSRHTPESNHVAEGANASARVRDFFEEGRDVPHVEDGEFTDRHLTTGEHASQFAPPERHVTEGPDASTLKDAPPTPPGGQRHLTRGPGASSLVPEERHVTVGPEASGLTRRGGEPPTRDEETDEDEGDDETEGARGDEEAETPDGDEKDAEHDDPVEDADEGGELAKNPEAYTPDELAKAELAREVQRMMLELYPIQTESRKLDTEDIESEPKFIESRSAPGGWDPERREPTDPMIYLTSLGVSTGEAFRVHVVSDEPVDLRDVVVAEAVAVPESDRRRIEARLRAEGAASFSADGYCLEFERAVPPAGTMYRLAPREVQSAHAPVRRMLAASRNLRQRGALAPDSDPERYFHTMRQWAIWTFEQGFDEEGFEEAFVLRTRENFRSAGAEWNDEVEGAVRALVPNRWRDVRAILREAGL